MVEKLPAFDPVAVQLMGEVVKAALLLELGAVAKVEWKFLGGTVALEVDVTVVRDWWGPARDRMVMCHRPGMVKTGTMLRGPGGYVGQDRAGRRARHRG